MSTNLNTPPNEETTPTPSTIGPSSSRANTNLQIPGATPHWQNQQTDSYFPNATTTQQRTRPNSPSQPTTTRRAMPNRFPRSSSTTSLSQRQRVQPRRSDSVASSSFNSRGGYNDTGPFSEAEEDGGHPFSDDEDLRTPRRGRPLSVSGMSVHEAVAAGEEIGPDGLPLDHEFNEDDPLTVKDRQSLINVQHPFGLPIWKPALYKKSRTVTRNAETELHAKPSRAIETHYLPGNIFWTVVFGWWMAIIFLVPALLLYFVPRGGKQYSRLLYGLSWYIFWPFGKYVQGDGPEEEEEEDEEDEEYQETSTDSDVEYGRRESQPASVGSSAGSGGTIRGPRATEGEPVALPTGFTASASWEPIFESLPETTTLLRTSDSSHLKSYGSVPADLGPSFDAVADAKRHWLGRACFWLFLFSIIFPIMLFVCLICWALVITIPMAKLQWALIKCLIFRHNSIQFCSAPQTVLVSSAYAGDEERPISNGTEGSNGVDHMESAFTVKSLPRLEAGQSAPTGSPNSTVLLCTYRAVGLTYYKYTVGGVNILFVNLMPVVFFVILDGFFLLPYVDRKKHAGEIVAPILKFFASRALIFVLSLASVIPLSYFIGMAVASISAQSSIGMGAVINATFGSIIEIILYGIALTEGKGRLVEGSIVGSLLAGVLLMPGASMCSGALRQKEQKFNAKSAGVTSTMLIMAIIGTLTPTLFYQVYGNFKLICNGCGLGDSETEWDCQQCYYEHPDPVTDPFYQNTVKQLMYFCAWILVFSYLIGLWFSLRTHASQIWQNPQQLMHPLDLNIGGPGGAPTGTGRQSMYNRLVASQLAQAIPQQTHKLLRKASVLTAQSIRGLGGDDGGGGSRNPQRGNSAGNDGRNTAAQSPYLGPLPGPSSVTQGGTPSPTLRRVSYAAGRGGGAHHIQGTMSPTNHIAPLLETVSKSVKDPNAPPLPLPENMTTEDFTRAVAVTVSALRQRDAGAVHAAGLHSSGHGGDAAGGHGGHEAPSWSRITSATVLLGCTALYACIAEILVAVVDVVLEGSGIDEKFLGITLFALVPNTTEFMNAISFALNGNIALSMEIGSAYALQVCLLQIPAMVAFSAWYDPRHLGSVADTFTLIFPRWDVIAIILSIFLLTYTYIEAKSNYHRGSTLILSYLVLTAGFYFTPSRLEEESLTRWFGGGGINNNTSVPSFSLAQTAHTMLLSLFTR
ncbi:hypothetical protein FRB97_000050 [Tulasnella sp. 331]|nr:hypothetical protein FRB97_000050 [Tulasnella sp. 331]KAG8890677.1 hypothetical protein FRB98_006180 [Tulasnella sp. 332]